MTVSSVNISDLLTTNCKSLNLKACGMHMLCLYVLDIADKIYYNH